MNPLQWMGAVKMRVQTTKHHGLPDSLDSDINSLLFQTLFVFAIQRLVSLFFLELYCLFTKFTMKHARLYFYLIYLFVLSMWYLMLVLRLLYDAYYPTFNWPLLGVTDRPGSHASQPQCTSSPSTNGAHLHVHLNLINQHYKATHLTLVSAKWTPEAISRCTPVTDPLFLSRAVSSDLPVQFFPSVLSPAISCSFIQVSYWSVWFLPCPRVPVKT